MLSASTLSATVVGVLTRAVATVDGDEGLGAASGGMTVTSGDAMAGDDTAEAGGVDGATYAGAGAGAVSTTRTLDVVAGR